MTGTNTEKTFQWRSVFVSMAAVISPFICMQREVQAGLISPLAPENAAFDSVLCCDADLPGTSSAPTEPVPGLQRPERRGRVGVEMLALEAMAGPWGASTPDRSSAGWGAAAPVAVQDAPALPPAACRFRYLRETAVHLPHPPPEELLDPPKAG